MNDLKNIFEEIETSRGKVGEILGLSALLNKIVCPTYLSSDKDYLIVSNLKQKETLQESLLIQNLKSPFFLLLPSNISLQN